MSHAEALAHLRAGRPEAGAALLESLLSVQPADATGWFLLGACRHALNELPAAADAFSRSLSLDPSNFDAQLAFVSVLRAAGDTRGALASCQRAQARFSNEPRLLYATALCLEDLGQTEEALAHYDTALAISPDLEDALHNRGLLLTRIGKLEDAESNHRLYVVLYPDSPRARSVLADIMLALSRFDSAITTLDELARIDPADASAPLRRGVALACLGRFDQALTAFESARALSAEAVEQFVQRAGPGSFPDVMLSPANIYLARGWDALGRCDWSDWTAYLEVMLQAACESGIVVEPAVAFMATHLPLSGPQRLAIAAKAATHFEARAAPLPPPAARAPGPLRIGILSTDFREQSKAHLLLPLFELIDKSRFDLFCYALTADDGSTIRARIRSAAAGFRELTDLTDRDAAIAIRADDIDILVDVTGYKTGGRFAVVAQRPARIQATYRGFSASLGSSRVDYAIVDRVVGADDAEWMEARVFLPDTYYLCDWRMPAPAASVSRRDYGLPDDAFVYCAFHKPEKITPDVFDLWMAILTGAPGSVLWFGPLPDAAMRNLRAAAAHRSVDPARLAFAPFEPRQEARYFARQRLGSLMLDALHHNAIASACDALAAGLPVLTLKGSAMASRAGESLLRAAGLPELVAPDKDAYVALAVEIASDFGRLAAFRQTLAERRGPLFNTAAQVRALENAFLEMWRRYEQRH